MCLCHRNRGPQKIVTGIWPCWSQSQSAMLTWCSSRRGQAFKQVPGLASMRLDSISSTLVKFIIQPKILRGKTSTSISSFQEPLTSSAAHLRHPWPFEISMLFPNASDTINHISTIYQETLRIAWNLNFKITRWTLKRASSEMESWSRKMASLEPTKGFCSINLFLSTNQTRRTFWARRTNYRLKL